MDGRTEPMDYHPGQQPCRVLVVEDDRPTREVLGKALAFFGFPVDTAGTLAGGLAEFGRGPCDAVVLDLNLPDGNGVELLRRIRDEHRPVRVAVCTATKDEDLLREVRQLAPDALFTKPYDLPPLIRWLGQEEIQDARHAGARRAVIHAAPDSAHVRRVIVE